MAYFAQRPCSFGGEHFKIGEQIPDRLLLPGAINNLLTMGVITRIVGESEMKKEDTSVNLETAFVEENGKKKRKK